MVDNLIYFGAQTVPLDLVLRQESLQLDEMSQNVCSNHPTRQGLRASDFSELESPVCSDITQENRR